jgi:hypothetical protein
VPVAVAAYSIRDRILKGLGYVAHSIQVYGCSLFDPRQDTEVQTLNSKAQKGGETSSGRVSSCSTPLVFER